MPRHGGWKWLGRSAAVGGLVLLLWGADVRGQGAIGFAAIPGAAFDGAALNVVPVVSADRRYVRLGVRPLFSTIDGFDTFPVPGAVAGGGTGGLGGLGGLGGGGGGLGGAGGGGLGGGLRSVGPGPRLGATAPGGPPKTFVPKSVAAALAAGPAPSPTPGRNSPATTRVPAPRPSTYRPGDPYAGIGPSGFEATGGPTGMPGRVPFGSSSLEATARRLQQQQQSQLPGGPYGGRR